MPSPCKQPITVQTLTDIHNDTAVERPDSEFLEVGDNFIRARMPLDTLSRQAAGILHGGVQIEAVSCRLQGVKLKPDHVVVERLC